MGHPIESVGRYAQGGRMERQRARCAFCGKQVAIGLRETVHFLDRRFMHRRCYWQNALTDYRELERWSEAFGVSTESMKHSLQKVIWEYSEEDTDYRA
jgi:hypothetical protein